jgi:hypothetical protein
MSSSCMRALSLSPRAGVILCGSLRDCSVLPYSLTHHLTQMRAVCGDRVRSSSLVACFAMYAIQSPLLFVCQGTFRQPITEASELTIFFALNSLLTATRAQPAVTSRSERSVCTLAALTFMRFHRWGCLVTSLVPLWCCGVLPSAMQFSQTLCRCIVESREQCGARTSCVSHGR